MTTKAKCYAYGFEDKRGQTSWNTTLESGKGLETYSPLAALEGA